MATASTTGDLSFFKHFGGPDTDYATDIVSFGAFLYISGYSTSGGLSTGFDDAFVMKVLRTGELQWAKYVGTSIYSERAHSLAVTSNGIVFVTANIEHPSYSYNLNDLMVFGFTDAGATIFLSHLGGENEDTPSAIVYNSIRGRFQCFAQS